MALGEHKTHLYKGQILLAVSSELRTPLLAQLSVYGSAIGKVVVTETFPAVCGDGFVVADVFLRHNMTI